MTSKSQSKQQAINSARALELLLKMQACNSVVRTSGRITIIEKGGN